MSKTAKTTSIISLIIAMTVTLMSCSTDNGTTEKNVEKPNIIKYELKNEEIGDTPLKASVTQEYIVKENVTKNELENLLAYLYQEQIKRTGFKYQEHITGVHIYVFNTVEHYDSEYPEYVGFLSTMGNDDDSDNKYTITVQEQFLKVSNDDYEGTNQ